MSTTPEEFLADTVGLPERMPALPFPAESACRLGSGFF